MAKSETIQKELLSDEQALVEYFFAESSLYVFVIDRNNFTVKELPLPDNLEEDIKLFNSAIRVSDQEAYSNLAFRLYNLVFKPVAELTNRKNLIVIPDGYLWQINFDLLLSKEGSKSDYRHYQYLINLIFNIMLMISIIIKQRKSFNN